MLLSLLAQAVDVAYLLVRFTVADPPAAHGLSTGVESLADFLETVIP